MKEHPILFSGPMVCALLKGTKCQTRRVVKPKIVEAIEFLGGGPSGEPATADDVDLVWKTSTDDNDKRLPAQWVLECSEYPEEGCLPIGNLFGNVGDRLWVKETWQFANWTEDGMPQLRYRADGALRWFEDQPPDDWGELLTDIWATLSEPENYKIDGKAADRQWRPSIFMPRWAARILLEVTVVRLERLQNISEADALAEGAKLHRDKDPDYGYAGWYRALWESINGPDSWAANPWVWVIEFDRVRQ